MSCCYEAVRRVRPSVRTAKRRNAVQRYADCWQRRTFRRGGRSLPQPQTCGRSGGSGTRNNDHHHLLAHPVEHHLMAQLCAVHSVRAAATTNMWKIWWLWN